MNRHRKIAMIELEAHGPEKEPTLAQMRRWGKRAETLHLKAAELFNLIEEDLGEDHSLTSAAGMLMCEAAGFPKFRHERDRGSKPVRAETAKTGSVHESPGAASAAIAPPSPRNQPHA